MKNIGKSHFEIPLPFPFRRERARKKRAGENRCGESAEGQETTFHSQISFRVYLAQLYFGSV